MLNTPNIRSMWDECCERQGWCIPIDVVSYCVQVLEQHVDRPDWQPKPSYAEQFMQIRTTRQAIDLGNECWFTRAVFPELMSSRGIASSYYVDMGTACFDRVLSATQHPTVRRLRDHFEFTAEVAWTAVHSKNGFRSMWD